MLVYFETYAHPSEAIEREKEIKGWRREKLRLILSVNPDWADWSAEWRDDESWKAIPEAEFRPVLRRGRAEGRVQREQIPRPYSRAEENARELNGDFGMTRAFRVPARVNAYPDTSLVPRKTIFSPAVEIVT
ncbi:MAG TPA: hypothetical protein VKY85_15715 [Candidatus Angelobacter sp.]|nr:hypothetical protein [Candidatus Angelobacter sp.]